jgi:hypothetical protein
VCTSGPMRSSYEMGCLRCCLLYLRALVRQGAPERAQEGLFGLLAAQYGPAHAQAVRDGWQRIGPVPKPRSNCTSAPTACALT